MAPLSFGRPTLRALFYRQPSQHLAPLIAVILAGLSLPHAASAGGVLPQGGRYVAGAGTIVSAMR
ncbi:hypothetical protein HDG38_003739 [Paraburkholderia sp. WSM4177]|nr:hypothetical protein [Paraburkholderia sp. WSM4177]MBB5484041.1 hypothetical protein [Paraburkholderia sp. WSM4180]